jgi:RNA polymerase sigma-70 factor (sigma-E family)
MEVTRMVSVSEGTRESIRDREFTEWLAAREPALQRTAHLITGDLHSAQDLVQAALTKLYLVWDRLDDKGHLDAYVRRIMVNEHTSTWRRAWRRREVSRGEVPDRGVEASYDPGRDAVWRYLVTLAPRQRAVVVLRYYEDLSEREIADVLGVSVGTVKSQTSKAMANLRRTLEGAEL